MEFRLESDSMGVVQVPADRYWGAQTQRSLEHFRIGGHRFPPAIIRAFGLVKKAAALTNCALGQVPGPQGLPAGPRAGGQRPDHRGL
jgi:fumarate hydratase class II